jgi:hypothetical protein
MNWIGSRWMVVLILTEWKRNDAWLMDNWLGWNYADIEEER